MSGGEPTDQSFARQADGDGPPRDSGSSRLHTLHPSPSRHVAAPLVAFDRHELREIFNLYGRKVAAGDWRDYAIDFNKDSAVFSIFRRTSEVPIYRIEKDPAAARKQGAYRVVTATGLILKRGHDLARVIAVLDKPLKLVVA